MARSDGIFHDLPLNDYLAKVLINARHPPRCRPVDDRHRRNDNDDKNDNDRRRDDDVDDDNNDDEADRDNDGNSIDINDNDDDDNDETMEQRCYDVERFVGITKKMRQQILSRLLSRLHNQLVVYNVKALFRAYMIYHRDDRLIYAICDVFSKRRVYDANALRQEMITKNTKPFQRKILRNKFCNEVMTSQPHILRLFDTRALTYCRTKLMMSTRLLHNVSNCLPVIMCLKVEDIDTIFERCRKAHSRQSDFPIDLLPGCIREPFARLLGLRKAGRRRRRRCRVF